MFRQVKRKTAGRRNFEDVSSSSSGDKKGGADLISQLNNIYQSRLTFYDIPPLEEITLEEFENWSIDRLKLLIEIESYGARSKSIKDIEVALRPLLLKYLPMNGNSSDGKINPTLYQERKKDHYSHFILRLVFCRSEELRKKFIKNEGILFRIRYNLLTPKEQEDFLMSNSHRLHWKFISQEEKLANFDQLYNASNLIIKNHLLQEGIGSEITNEQVKQHIKFKENFIKLPFEKVTNLINSRSIFLKGGYAYIPTSLQLNLIVTEFQDNLNTILLRTFQTLPRLEEDDRILPLLNNLGLNFSNIQYDTNNFGSDDTNDINAQSIQTPEILQHYPLCARILQKQLSFNSHLKYGGRQQLGLFLKGIGLNVDEALKFWSQQFLKKINQEKFNKEYKYNIRHNYGLEGARINYKPWDCATILAKAKPSKDEYHGCPYRDLSVNNLISNLNELGIEDQHQINEIMDDVDKRDYSIACTRVFELTHQKELKASSGAVAESMHINHPNLYFDRSRQLERSMEKKKEISV
ncbi:eukaryotic and archaeal DNA primase, large subunit-domain-containing protein [Scheffersomyces coipomensis]|uniref:eukaryotic and archaeal DNA primase, large subunit-domain-containing protein n=1 Tax=Scheffersomyces coipomensis TaxID=1788519 RepID=UPI00315DBB3D